MAIDKTQLKLMDWDVKLPFNMFSNMLMINHPPVLGAYELDVGKFWGNDKAPNYEDALKKVLKFWKEHVGPDVTSEIWSSMAKSHQQFRDMLDAGDVESLDSYLVNMFEQPVTEGLAQGTRYKAMLKDPEYVKNAGAMIYDKFIGLMEAVSIIPTFAPEDYTKEPRGMLKYYTIESDKYLELLEDHFGKELKAPMYQGGHFGIKTAHGLYSDRDIMSLFIAIRIFERYGNQPNIPICDLGGGVGHLAFWLTKFGFTNITLVEVPTVAAAAVYWLETNLPGNKIKILSNHEFSRDIWKLVINQDGITGYGDDAQKYADHIMKTCDHFYSVNKETDITRVTDLFHKWTRVTRNPFWLRRGYVEEDYIK